MTNLLMTQHTGPAWTFAQGFLAGQGVFIVLCLLFMRYVVFAPGEPEDQHGWRRRRAERAKKNILSTTAVPQPPASHMLEKAGYDMATHPAESSDWINVLFSQVLQGYRNDLLSGGGEEGARKQFERWFNPPGKQQSWLDPIEVTGINLGTSFPLLSNARIRPADGEGSVRAEVDIDFADTVSLAIATSVIINFPRPRFAILPVAVGVELVSVGGTLSVQIHNPKDERTHLDVCLLPDFHLNLKTTSLLGSRAKLQDIPKIEQLLVSRLRAVIQDRLVMPNNLKFSLPRLIPRPEENPEPVIPTSNDLRTMALGAMSRGIAKMGQDLADRVAAIGPTDSASAAGSASQGSAGPAPTDSGSEQAAVLIGADRPRMMPPKLAAPSTLRDPPGLDTAPSSPSNPSRSQSIAVASAVRPNLPPRRPASSDQIPLAGQPGSPLTARRLGALNSAA